MNCEACNVYATAMAEHEYKYEKLKKFLKIGNKNNVDDFRAHNWDLKAKYRRKS